MSYSSKLSVQRRRSWEPQFITSWSEVQVTMWTCNWHLKWRQSCGTEPLTCGIWCYFQVDGVRIMLSLGTSSQGLLKIEELSGGIGKHSSLKCCVFNYFFWPFCMSCGILVSQSGIELVHPALGQWSLNHQMASEILQQQFFCCHRLDGGDTTGLAVKGQGCY